MNAAASCDVTTLSNYRIFQTGNLYRTSSSSSCLLSVNNKQKYYKMFNKMFQKSLQSLHCRQNLKINKNETDYKHVQETTNVSVKVGYSCHRVGILGPKGCFCSHRVVISWNEDGKKTPRDHGKDVLYWERDVWLSLSALRQQRVP